MNKYIPRLYAHLVSPSSVLLWYHVCLMMAVLLLFFLTTWNYGTNFWYQIWKTKLITRNKISRHDQKHFDFYFFLLKKTRESYIPLYSSCDFCFQDPFQDLFFWKHLVFYRNCSTRRKKTSVFWTSVVMFKQKVWLIPNNSAAKGNIPNPFLNVTFSL